MSKRVYNIWTPQRELIIVASRGQSTVRERFLASSCLFRKGFGDSLLFCKIGLVQWPASMTLCKIQRRELEVFEATELIYRQAPKLSAKSNNWSLVRTTFRSKSGSRSGGVWPPHILHPLASGRSLSCGLQTRALNPLLEVLGHEGSIRRKSVKRRQNL